MLPSSVKREISRLFQEALEEDRRRLYFHKYHTGRSLKSISLIKEFEGKLGEESIEQNSTELDNADLIQVDDKPVLVIAPRESSWFVVFSSQIEDPVRRKLGNLASIKGWLIEAWIPGSTLDDIYNEYSPDGESISLKRSWDPYYLYQRNSKVPQEYKKYFSEHPREFSQQNVEVEITTPKWRLEETMNNALTDFLEEKSETERSDFIMEAPPETGMSSDGGVVSNTRSSVRVKESGKVTHQSGDIGATFKLVDETAERSQWVYDQFEGLSATYSHTRNQDGSMSLVNYSRPESIRFSIPEAFTREISIKLSNFLTVGQKDVDLYGIVANRSGKKFTTETHIPFNNDEYDITVTGIRNDEETAIYVRPTEGSTAGLVYFYHKLLQKFDPNIEVEEVDEVPRIGMVA